MSVKTNADRRRTPRYALKDDVYLAFKSDFGRVGKIKDVSRGGLAVEFLVLEPYEKTPSSVEVDIIDSSGDFKLKSVRCKIAYDVKVESPSMDYAETRRCGLKFEHPIPELHNRLLGQLVADYTHPMPLPEYVAAAS